jgi:hypothetical protein
MLDKEKLRAKREKEMAESVNVWESFLSSPDVKKEEGKKAEPDKKKK